MSIFYVKDGLSFQRLEDGKIRIGNCQPVMRHELREGHNVTRSLSLHNTGDGAVGAEHVWVWSVVVDVAGFASAVASMSVLGESGERWGRAHQFLTETVDSTGGTNCGG